MSESLGIEKIFNNSDDKSDDSTDYHDDDSDCEKNVYYPNHNIFVFVV